MRGKALHFLHQARSAVINHQALLSSRYPVSSSVIVGTIHPATVMSTSGAVSFSSVAEEKRALRSRIRKELRSLPVDRRIQEDMKIQNIVLDSSWFKSAKRLCAYMSCEALREVDTTKILSEILKLGKKLYVPRVEDKNSHMRMLHISTTEDLVVNSMNILEPSPKDACGIHREDVMLASEPVDIVLLPGLAFDRDGRRLGRGGGYYDVFLKNYQEIAKERKWKQPVLIALAYSTQFMDETEIPVTDRDVSIDVVVSPSGVFRITPIAFEGM